MKTQILFIAVLMSVVNLVNAQPVNPENVRQKPTHEMRQLKQQNPHAGLNLTDVQKEAFKKSHLEMQKQIMPLRNQLGELKAHQKTLMSVETTDLAAINKNIEKMGALKVEIEKTEAKYRLDMRAQLTEEQRLKFDLGKGKMKEKRAHGAKGQKQKVKKHFRG